MSTINETIQSTLGGVANDPTYRPYVQAVTAALEEREQGQREQALELGQRLGATAGQVSDVLDSIGLGVTERSVDPRVQQIEEIARGIEALTQRLTAIRTSL